eukprot:TRINITY_DN63395_c0_g1_i1.p1 TRINITY_DN63395_c0_g1~~TRINITY_DN63395_c0_g1_i1.p1  ORF type:complete len:266 (-),score=35.05 TRINITY_DN63395_c0_g1_i1:271-1032(-)
MGRKRQQIEDGVAGDASTSSTCWCYYCGLPATNLKELVAHQRSKHFACPLCNSQNAWSIEGLQKHVSNQHNRLLSAVPNAIEGRRDPSVSVNGMTGIPLHADASNAAGSRSEAEQFRRKHARTAPDDAEQFRNKQQVQTSKKLKKDPNDIWKVSGEEGLAKFGWQRRENLEKPGSYYYFHPASGRTVIDTAHKPSAASKKDLPPGWEKHASRSNPGMHYFRNRSTQQKALTVEQAWSLARKERNAKKGSESDS